MSNHDRMVDDLTETGGTLMRAAALLKSRGAKRVYAAVSHAVLNPTTVNRLRTSALEELVTTDTVPHTKVKGFALTELTVAPLLGDGHPEDPQFGIGLVAVRGERRAGRELMQLKIETNLS